MKKRVMALLLICMMLVGMVPGAGAVEGVAATPSVDISTEKVAGQANVYKMSVNLTSAAAVKQFELVMSYDNTKIALANSYDNYATVEVKDEDNQDKVEGLLGAVVNVPTGAGNRPIYTAPVVVYIKGGRSAIYTAAVHNTGIVFANVPMYEIYFKLINGATENDLKKGSIKIETDTSAGSFIDRAQSGQNLNGIWVVTEGDLTFRYKGEPDLPVTFSYPNSTVADLGALTLSLDKPNVDVAKTDTKVTPILNGTDTEGDAMNPTGVSYVFDPTVAPTGVTYSTTTGVVTVTKTAQSGTVGVTAKSGNISSNQETITITRASAVLTEVTLSKTAVTVAGTSAANQTVTATACDQFGEAIAQGVTWSVSDEDSANITANGSTITVKGAAKADDYTVTATLGGVSKTATLKVTRAASTAATVAVSDGQADILVPADGADAAASTAFTAVVKDQFGDVINGAGVTWTIAPATTGVSIANGVVTVTNAAKAAITNTTGTKLTVTAKSGSVSGTAQIMVKRNVAAATSVKLFRNSTLLGAADTVVMPVQGGEDKTYTYTAKLYDQYGAEMAGSAVWTAGTITDASHVSFDAATGILTVKAGATKDAAVELTATISAVSTKVTVKVTDLDVNWSGVSATGITYGAKNSAAITLPGSGTADAGGVAVSGTFSVKNADTIQGAGNQKVTVEFKVTTAGEYKDVVVAKDFDVAVAKKPVTVTAGETTRVYGEANPVLAFATPSDALVGSDTKEALGVTLTCAATDTTPAGTRVDITGTSVSANYAVTVTKGALTITKATITGITTAAPKATILADDVKNKDAATVKTAISLPAKVTVSYGSGKTAELDVNWAAAAEAFTVKGGMYTYKGTIVPGGNFNAYTPTLDAKLTVTPVTAHITKVDGASAEKLNSPVVVAKAKAQAATDYTPFKLPTSIELSFDQGVSAKTYENLTFSVPYTTLKNAAVGSKTNVAVTSIDSWVTIDASALTVEVQITDKYPVDITVTQADGVYSTPIADPVAAQRAIEDGTDSSGTWSYLYEGKTTADKPYSSAVKPTDAGTYTVTATLVSATHAGSQKSAEFKIAPKSAAGLTLTLPAETTYTYNTKPHTPEVAVKDGETALTKDKDYTVEYTANVNAGTATVKVIGKWNYDSATNKTITFVIDKAVITALKPVVTGTAEVGKVLSATLTGMAASELKWEWYRGEIKIDGAEAASYILTVADSGVAVTAKAVSLENNYTGTTLASDGKTVAKLAISGTVVITETNGSSAEGTIDVGDTLTANVTGLEPAAAQSGLTYQWYRGSEVIVDATDATYVVTEADAAAVLKVVVTPAEQFAGTAQATVEVGKSILSGSFTLAVEEAAEPAVGKKIVATVDLGEATEADYSVVWLRDGAVIAGASDGEYVITEADQGKTITAKAVSKGQSYTGEVKAATGISVPAAAPAKPVATASSGNASVTLQWSAPADNGAPIVKYQVQRGEESPVTLNPDVLQYTFTDLTNGTECTFKVSATNSVGTTQSDAVKATPAEPYNPGTGGGSSDSSTTEKNPDGSTTTTVTDKKTGAVTETTKYPNGTVQTVVTQKDGSMTATETRKDGTRVESATTAEGKTTATVKVPEKVEKVTVTISMPAKPKAGEVAVIVKADGTREVVKTSVATKNGLKIALSEGAKLEIVDNAKSFEDVKTDAWYADAVAFASSRELFQGNGTGFAPENRMTRGMLMTVLYRFENASVQSSGNMWYSDALAWSKEQGISDGTAPETDITREQLAVILYRYMGSPETAGMALSEFSDADNISSWAESALLWAVETGLLKGTAGALNPAETATRGEVATILQRFVEYTVK